MLSALMSQVKCQVELFVIMDFKLVSINVLRIRKFYNFQAAAHVNSESPAFSGLVSLNVPVEEMCKQAVELKTARAKHVKMPKSKLKVRVYAERFFI